MGVRSSTRWVTGALAATLCALGLSASAAPVNAKRPRLAVLAIKAEGVEPSIASTVDETLTADLAKSKKYEVIGRSEIEAIAGFQSDRMKLGCGDNSCLAEIGDALEVDRLVFGSLGKAGNTFVLNTKLLEIDGAHVIARDTEVVGSADALLSAVARSAQILQGEMPAPLGATTEVATSSGGLRHTAWPWVSLGAAVAAAGVGAYFGVEANSQYQINNNPANSNQARNSAASAGSTDQMWRIPSLARQSYSAGQSRMFVFGGGGG